MKMQFQLDSSPVVLSFPSGSSCTTFSDGDRVDLFENHGEEFVDGLGRALADGESFTGECGTVYVRFGKHLLYYASGD